MQALALQSDYKRRARPQKDKKANTVDGGEFISNDDPHANMTTDQIVRALAKDVDLLKSILEPSKRHPTELIRTTKPMKKVFEEIYMQQAKDTTQRQQDETFKPLHVDEFQGHIIVNGLVTPFDSEIESDNMKAEAAHSIRNYLYDILHDEATDGIAMLIYVIVVLSIFVSVMCTMLSTVPALEDHEQLFSTVEVVVTVCFTVEYLSRVLVVRNRMSYVLSVMNVLDVLAILPFYLKKLTGNSGISGVGGVLRALRLTRIAKIRGLATPYTHILIEALISTIRGTGSAVAIFLFIATVMSGTLVYNCEKEASSGFTSIPKGMWWSIVTMTTVGYGDIAPTTLSGYILGAFTILIGMSLTSLIIMVIGQYYIDLLSEFEDEMKDIKELLFNKYGNAYKHSVLTLDVDTLWKSIVVELRLIHEREAGNPLVEKGEERMARPVNSIYNRKSSL